MAAFTAEQRGILSKECANAEAIVHEISEKEHHDEQTLAKVLADSPVQPWVVAQGKCLLLLRATRGGCLYGSASGEGILIARLPSHSAMLIRWSAPLFVKLKLRSAGFTFGRRKTATFAVCTTSAAQQALAGPRGHRVVGMECSALVGSTLHSRSDFISVNMADDISAIGMSKVSGCLVDLSAAWGALKADAAKNAAVYGGATPVEILAGAAVVPPSEFQPLYSRLSLIVHGVEKTSGVGPARMSASLERFSAGVDPDRRMVLPGGIVVE